MCLTGEEDIKDKEDIKGPEKRYLSESRHVVTNGAAVWQKYHLSEEQVCNVCKLCNKCKPLELCKLYKLFCFTNTKLQLLQTCKNATYLTDTCVNCVNEGLFGVGLGSSWGWPEFITGSR